MTVTLNELEHDEQEAITKYTKYLAQGTSRKNLKIIRAILLDEVRHLRLLRKLK
jgi:hypothetical protein